MKFSGAGAEISIIFRVRLQQKCAAPGIPDTDLSTYEISWIRIRTCQNIRIRFTCYESTRPNQIQLLFCHEILTVQKLNYCYGVHLFL